MKQQPFCLAGMHRSGTSLMANWFFASDIFMGQSLYGATSTNKKGHFEDHQFLVLHKSDLSRKDHHQSGLIVKAEDYELDELSKIDAKKLIQERQKYQIWGWKEPRSTLYLQDWKNLLPELKVIAIYRHPEQVIGSLYRRLRKNKWYKTNNPIKRLAWYIDIDRNKAKWESIFLKTYNTYNDKIINFKQKHPSHCLILSLSDVRNHPQAAQEKIEKLLQVELCSFHRVFEKELISNHQDTSTGRYHFYEQLEKLKANLNKR